MAVRERVTPSLEGRDRILVAIDTPDQSVAVQTADGVRAEVGGLKVGLEFFNSHGPDGVRAVAGDAPLFLDLKFHDIPNTVAGAVRSAVAACRPMMLNVHAAGGAAMMAAAVSASRETAATVDLAPPLMIAVTVLTSLDDSDLEAVGQIPPARDQVVRLARLAQEAGCDGVVCSAREIEALRSACGPDFRLVVPGIRPAGSAADDQKRTMTPRDAVDAGADYLVIGRPITRAPDPAAAARTIVETLV